MDKIPRVGDRSDGRNVLFLFVKNTLSGSFHLTNTDFSHKNLLIFKKIIKKVFALRPNYDIMYGYNHTRKADTQSE